MSKKTFMESIIKRFMTTEEFESFVEKYQANRKKIGFIAKLTDEDRQMVAEVMAGEPIKSIEKKYGKNEPYINKRVVMVCQGK